MVWGWEGGGVRYWEALKLVLLIRKMGFQKAERKRRVKERRGDEQGRGLRHEMCRRRRRLKCEEPEAVT